MDKKIIQPKIEKRNVCGCGNKKKKEIEQLMPSEKPIHQPISRMKDRQKLKIKKQ